MPSKEDWTVIITHIHEQHPDERNPGCTVDYLNLRLTTHNTYVYIYDSEFSHRLPDHLLTLLHLKAYDALITAYREWSLTQVSSSPSPQVS